MKIDKGNVKDILSLSPMQEGLLFHYLTKEKQLYTERLEVYITGQIDDAAFKATWETVIQSHDMLRCTYRWEEAAHPVQIVLRDYPLNIEIHDVFPGQDQAALGLNLEDGINLKEMPYRIVLYKYGKENKLCFVFHHILMDGWSLGIILRQFFSVYHAKVNNQAAEPLRSGNFKDFLSVFSKEKISADEQKYWRAYLNGYDVKYGVKPLLETDASERFLHRGRIFDSVLYDHALRFSKKYHITLANILYGIWALILSRFYHDDDVVFGIVNSGRNAAVPGVDDIVGLLIDTLPLRVRLSSDITLAEMIKRLQDNVNEVFVHNKSSLTEIGKCADMIQASALFDSIVAVENYPLGDLLNIQYPAEADQASSISVSGYEMHEYTNYPISLIIDFHQGLSVKFVYDSVKYEAFVIDEMIRTFETLLERLETHADIKIKDICVTNSETKKLVKTVFNNTRTDYPKNNTIIDLFTQQVCVNGDKTAITYGDERISYAQLDRMSDALASVICKKAEPGQYIGIMCERKPNMVIGMLAILKSSCTYVPVNPHYPLERQQFMLNDMGARLMLINIDAPVFKGVDVIDIRRIADEESGPVIRQETSPDSVACVIYTSGSTGNPKGVMLTHQGIIRLIRNTNYIEISTEDRLVPTCPLEFDVANFEIWGMLLNGASIIFLDQEKMLSPEFFGRFLEMNSITMMWLTTPLFNQMAYINPSMFKPLRCLLVGGDALSPYHIAKVRDALPHLRLINGYGPTENSVFSTTFEIDRDYETRIPIGRPIANSSVYILDQYDNIAPIGAVGELCVGLDGVSKGYLNNGALTNTKFVTDVVFPARKMYRTGDLARFMPNGIIDFLGRTDNQVKVRGFRVELTEIENTLNLHDQVSDCAVIVSDEDGFGRRLIAFVEAKEDIPASDLRSFMQKHMPAHCIPSQFVVMPQLPHSENGKIIRKLLKHYAIPQEHDQSKDFTLLSTLEKEIAAMWEELIKVPVRNSKISFFELGGNSLHTIQMINHIKKKYQVDISIAELFTYTTVESLSSFIHEKKNAALIAPAGDEKNDLSEKSAPMNQEEYPQGIAVIGIAAKFPGAQNYAQFWHNLTQAKESITYFTEEELRGHVDEKTLRDPNYIRAKGIIADHECFDPGVFSYSEREAELMDPQLRLLHELIYSALEDAGYNGEPLEHTTGVFVGASPNYTWLTRIAADMNDPTAMWEAGNLNFHSLAMPISYKLNLHGPSVMVSTACSSSLAAVHQACESLTAGECDMAVAGGVSISFPVKQGYLYQEGMIKSKDGHCRAFDAEASGTVSGDGAGLVVLKVLKSALRDNDHIYAVIKGSAMNNDGGRKMGYTTPSMEGQIEVIRNAQANAGVQPEDVSYIEAHGTGTSIGDAIELQALKSVFAKNKPKSIAIGSVKSNIGHLDCASGIAGFIKTVLSLSHRSLPPCINVKTPNKLISEDSSPLNLVSRTITWETEKGALRAGVSSFGIGGSNVHVIAEEPPTNRQKASPDAVYQIIPVSANTKESLMQNMLNLKCYAEQGGDRLVDIAYTLQTGRKALPYRAVFVSKDKEGFLQTCASALKEESHYIKGLTTKEPKNIVFMFSGQGSQHLGMGKRLYELFPLFRDISEQCFCYLEDGSEQLRDLFIRPLSEGESNERIDRVNRTGNAQVLIFIFEYALATTLMDLGIRPEIMIGHSIGEYVAATVSGVLSWQEALRLVRLRANMMQRQPKGAMLSVQCDRATINELLKKYHRVDIAAINGPSQIVLSGDYTVIHEIQCTFESEHISCIPLKVSHAFHSYMMEGIIEPYKAALEKIRFNKPQIPYLSNVTGRLITAEQACDPDYYLTHTRKTVRFGDGINLLFNGDYSLFIEVGPLNTLSKLAAFSPFKKEAQIIPLITNARQSDDVRRQLLDGLGRLWAFGCRIDWKKLYETPLPYKLPMPTYAFEKIPFVRYDTETAAAHRATDEDFLYETRWVKDNTIENAAFSDHQGVIVFGEKEDDVESLSQCLAEKAQRVIQVVHGERFVRNGDVFYIDEENEHDYRRLMERLNDGEYPVIINLWGCARTGASEDVFGYCGNDDLFSDKGFISTLYIVRAFSSVFKNTVLRLIEIHTNLERVNTDDTVIPSKAIVKGLLNVISLEYENITVKSIDAGRRIGSVDQIVREAYLPVTAAKTEYIALRDSARYSLRSYKKKLMSSLYDKPCLKPGGVYLLTGGLGGIGSALTAYLCQEYHATVIITTRSEASIAAAAPTIRTLEKNGAIIDVFAVDICNLTALKKVIRDIQNKYHRIDGVFHMAGANDHTLIHNIHKEQLASVWQPKIQGTGVLYQALKETLANPPEFVALFSSITGFTGYIGQTAYTAANAFLESYASLGNRLGLRTVCINWDTWADVGMAARAAAQIAQIESEAFAAKDDTVTKDVADTTHSYTIELSSAEDWVLKEHTLLGKPILPGTAFIEYIHRGFSRYTGRFEATISELFFLQPLFVVGQMTLHIAFTRKATGYSFAVSSNNDHTTVVYVHGFIKEGVAEDTPYQDVSQWPLAEMNEPFRPKRNLNENEIIYGPRWDNIRQMRGDHRRGVADIVLDDAFTQDMPTHPLHPAMLDNAVSFMDAMIDSSQAYLPFAYKNIRIFSPLIQRIKSYSQIKQHQIGGELVSFACEILDAEHNRILSIEEFSMKSVAVTGNKALTIKQTGDLGSLYFTPCDRRKPSAKELEIQVYATGLNFKDVLYALGTLDDAIGSGLTFGLECSGVITALGDDVKDFRVGDAVMGMVKSGFCDYVIADEISVMRKPKQMSFEQAATIPIAYITAHHALVEKGALKPADKLLITAATGGVGLAAVRIAQTVGANIFALVGNPEKRAYLKGLGIPHVYDSRTLDFAREIASKAGQVEIILNSNSGKAIAAELSLLKKHGRFLELGVNTNAEQFGGIVGQLSEKAVSYHQISIDPALPDFAQMIKEVERLVFTGVYTPLPITVYDLEQVQEAFRFMASAKHIGKIVVVRPLAKQASIKADQRKDIFLNNGLTTEEGLRILRKILDGMRYDGLQSITVSKTDITKRFKIMQAQLESLETDRQEPRMSAKKNRPPQVGEYIAPITQTEHELTHIFESFMAIEPFGIDDNFFDMGASSLDIVQINSRVNKLFPKDASIVKMYNYPTIRKLAAYLSENGRGDTGETSRKNLDTLKRGRTEIMDILNRRDKTDG